MHRLKGTDPVQEIPRLPAGDRQARLRARLSLLLCVFPSSVAWPTIAMACVCGESERRRFITSRWNLPPSLAALASKGADPSPEAQCALLVGLPSQGLVPHKDGVVVAPINKKIAAPLQLLDHLPLRPDALPAVAVAWPMVSNCTTSGQASRPSLSSASPCLDFAAIPHDNNLSMLQARCLYHILSS